MGEPEPEAVREEETLKFEKGKMAIVRETNSDLCLLIKVQDITAKGFVLASTSAKIDMPVGETLVIEPDLDDPGAYLLGPMNIVIEEIL